MPERKHFFLMEVFPKGGLPSEKVPRIWTFSMKMKIYMDLEENILKKGLACKLRELASRQFSARSDSTHTMQWVSQCPNNPVRCEGIQRTQKFCETCHPIMAQKWPLLVAFKDPPLTIWGVLKGPNRPAWMYIFKCSTIFTQCGRHVANFVANF